jgi:hypothetical protein
MNFQIENVLYILDVPFKSGFSERDPEKEEWLSL